MADYLVAGAAGGMGRAVCEALLRDGHRVWGIDRAEIPAAAENLHAVRADIRSTSELEKAFETVRGMTDHLDGIIYLAGVYDLNSLIEMPEEDFVRDFDINLFGAYRINRIFAPMLGRGGRIVIVTSELAPLNPLPFTGIYAVTKTALDRYAAALRMELQLLGIRVIAVRPGAVRTDMLPASVQRLSDFCTGTERFAVNAVRFRDVVEKVEARNIPPEKIAGIIRKALSRKRPKPVYKINRNPLLLLYSILPVRVRLWAVRKILS